MEPFGQGDVMGIAIDYDAHKIAISRNAMYLGDILLSGEKDEGPCLLNGDVKS